MTGCLQQDAAGNYMLAGTIMPAGDALKTRTKVKTDVDRDDTKVQATTQTKTEDRAVATGGTLSTYALLPKSGVSQRPPYRIPR